MADHEPTPVLISTKYGCGWSTMVKNKEKQRIMMTSKILVDYVVNQRNQKKIILDEDIAELWSKNYPQYSLPDLRGVSNLVVFWVDKGAPFKVGNMRGAEYIYFPSDDPSWFIA